MNSMNKSETINSIVRIISMIGAAIFNSLARLRKWLLQSGFDWVNIILVIILIIIIGSFSIVIIHEENCDNECQIQRQAEKIELFSALVNDCIERGLTLETCEELALQTTGDD